MAEGQEQAPEKKGSKKKLIIIIVAVLVILLGAGGGAAFFFMSGSDSAEEQAAAEPAAPVRMPPIYTKVRTLEGKPMFVVTLQSSDGRTHYMQAYVEAMSRDQAVADALTLHMPLVVARLNTLFSTQKFEDLVAIEGKQDLRLKATELVQSIMQEKIGKPGVETILFTNFVMQ